MSECVYPPTCIYHDGGKCVIVYWWCSVDHDCDAAKRS